MRNYYTDETYDPASEHYIKRPAKKKRILLTDNDTINKLNQDVADLNKQLAELQLEKHNDTETAQKKDESSDTAGDGAETTKVAPRKSPKRKKK